jgi:hypothetical protein
MKASITSAASVKMREVQRRPYVRGIGLHIGERTPCMLDNPLSHQGLIEIFSNQSDLFVRITAVAFIFFRYRAV